MHKIVKLEVMPIYVYAHQNRHDIFDSQCSNMSARIPTLAKIIKMTTKNFRNQHLSV